MEVYLIMGSKCSGKSTAARGLALTLKYNYFDDNFLEDALGLDYKKVGRGIQDAMIQSVGNMFSTRGIVYAIDCDFTDSSDCGFIEKLSALCKKSKWYLHGVFLESDYVAAMRNMINLYMSYGLNESECKEYAEDYFRKKCAARYFPDEEQKKRFFQSYFTVPANILVEKGVVSYILEKIEETTLYSGIR